MAELCVALKSSDNTPCGKKATRLAEGKKLCGIHARKYHDATMLDGTPVEKKDKKKKEEKKLEEKPKISHRESVVTAQEKNKKSHKKSKVMLSSAEDPPTPGFERIYMAKKFTTKRDGISYHELHPANMKHPIAHSIEAFHAFNALTAKDMDGEKVKDTFYEKRREGHVKKDTKPRRGEHIAYLAPDMEKPLNAIQTLRYKCITYQDLVLQESKFLDLANRLDLGFNIDIVCEKKFPPTLAGIEKQYKSGTFDHTHIIFTLLYHKVKELPAERLPWMAV